MREVNGPNSPASAKEGYNERSASRQSAEMVIIKRVVVLSMFVNNAF